MALLIKIVKGNKGVEEQLPVWVPDRYAYERHMERVNRLLEVWEKDQKDRGSSAFKEEKDRALRDTKPEMVINDSVPGRRIIAVGAGTAWRGDLEDLAKRVLEKEDPRKRLSRRDQIYNDIDNYAWLSKRLPKAKVSFYVAIKPEYTGG